MGFLDADQRFARNDQPCCYPSFRPGESWIFHHEIF